VIYATHPFFDQAIFLRVISQVRAEDEQEKYVKDKRGQAMRPKLVVEKQRDNLLTAATCAQVIQSAREACDGRRRHSGKSDLLRVSEEIVDVHIIRFVHDQGHVSRLNY
jgi:hypothetical protein